MWNKTDEIMPPTGEYVLVYGDGKRDWVKYVGGGFVRFQDDSVLLFWPTHWMALPDAPEE